MANTFQIRPLTQTFGLEITGLNLAEGIEEKLYQLLLSCFQQYQVLVFRKQKLSEADYLAIGRLFGRAAISRAPNKLEDYPQISVVSNIKKKGVIVPEYWHSDGHYALKAYRIVALYCKIAPRKGGETLFTNLRLAYETLPKNLKRMVEGKHITYESIYLHRKYVQHPIVVYNAKTHAKALYAMTAGAVKVDGMKPRSSKALIKKLEKHATNSSLIYQHPWQKGDLIIWDNLSLLHSATGVPKTPRLLHRLHLY